MKVVFSYSQFKVVKEVSGVICTICDKKKHSDSRSDYKDGCVMA